VPQTPPNPNPKPNRVDSFSRYSSRSHGLVWALFSRKIKHGRFRGYQAHDRPTLLSLAENGFLQASKGAENTKENFRQCFTTYVSPKKMQNSLILLVHAHLVVTSWQAIVISMGVHTWS